MTFAGAMGALLLLLVWYWAITGYWGSEWPNARSDAVAYTIVWLALTGTALAGWLALRAKAPTGDAPAESKGSASSAG